MAQVRKLRLGCLKGLAQEYSEEPVQPDFQTRQLPLKVILYLHPPLPMPHVSSFQQENTQEELISEPNTSELLLKLPSPVSPGMQVVLTAIQPQLSWGSQIATEYEMGGAISGSLPWLCTRVHFSFLKAGRDFSGIPVDRNLPAKAGDTISIPSLGRSHTPRSNKAHVPQLLSLCSRARQHNYWALVLQPPKPAVLEPCSATRSHLSEKPTLESSPCSPQLEKSPHSNEDPAQPKLN